MRAVSTKLIIEVPVLLAIFLGSIAHGQTEGTLKFNSATSNIEAYANGVWTKKVPQFKTQVFSSSGTFTAPADTSTHTVYKFTVTGGGGGGATPVAYACGGSAGGTAIYYGSGVAAGTNVTVTVGSGGGVNADGTASSVVFNGTTVTGNGGNKGVLTPCPAGGTATNGTINIQGGAGCNSNGSARAGGGGASFYGDGGGAASSGTALAGNAPGSGGGSAATGTSAGGANGLVVVEWIQ